MGIPEALPAWPPPPPLLPRALPPPRMLERMPRAGPSPVPLKEPWLAQQPPSPPLQSPPRHELRPVCPRRPVSKSLVRLSSSGPKRLCCAHSARLGSLPWLGVTCPETRTGKLGRVFGLIAVHQSYTGERGNPVPAKARPGLQSRWVGGTTQLSNESYTTDAPSLSDLPQARCMHTVRPPN